MIDHVCQHRVRYRECDPMGIVYHTHYVDYFEVARTEAIRDLGLVYRELEASGVIMPVVEVNVRYHRPAYYDDLLDITTRVVERPSVRVTFEYEVRRAGEEPLLATGRVVLCFMDADRRRPIAPPDSVRALFDAAWAAHNARHA